MTEEEKEVFAEMDKVSDKDREEVEIEDDFIMMLNGGKPAFDIAARERRGGENADIIVVDNLKDEEHPTDGVDSHMIPNYKEKMKDVIAALEKQEQLREAGKAKGRRDLDIDKEVKAVVNQKDLDSVF
mmetsp:Transcript_29458/g.44648  ORF Transcript_29458/g.44648 Transcript_29458/m.44648 type:complete len:128 (+) Transcript_29458:1088-1471(+)